MGADVDSGFIGLGAIEVEEGGDEVVEVDGDKFERADTGKLQECVEDILEMSALRLHGVQLVEHPPVARFVGGGQVLDQQVEVHRDGRERIADLVSQATGEAGDLGIPFGVPRQQVLAFLRVDRRYS